MPNGLAELLGLLLGLVQLPLQLCNASLTCFPLSTCLAELLDLLLRLVQLPLQLCNAGLTFFPLSICLTELLRQFDNTALKILLRLIELSFQLRIASLLLPELLLGGHPGSIGISANSFGIF